MMRLARLAIARPDAGWPGLSDIAKYE